jgi:hypothetical protein
MDLGTIRERLHRGEITNAFQLFSLLCLVYTNAYTYNAKNADIWLMARDLDLHTSTVFQSAYSTHADLFAPATADAKKPVRKLKLPKGPAAEKSVVLPHPTDLAGLNTGLQRFAAVSGVKVEPLGEQKSTDNFVREAVAAAAETVKAAAAEAAANPVAAVDLPLKSHAPAPLADGSSEALAPTPSASRRRKRSMSPSNVSVSVNISAEPIESGSGSSPHPARRSSRTPRYDETDGSETPATKRQRSTK